MKLAKEFGWQVVEGINIIGWQLHEQYTLWAGKDAGLIVPMEKAWEALREAADANLFINK
jgi:shikimate 5-dehydrogenase